MQRAILPGEALAPTNSLQDLGLSLLAVEAREAPDALSKATTKNDKKRKLNGLLFQFSPGPVTIWKQGFLKGFL